MASGSSIAWRRWADQGGFWNVLTWFGRSMDQLAGLLLNPLVVFLYARSLDADPYRISWFLGVFALSWTAGFALAPVLQAMTARVMPWIVGGYLLRTAAIVLMAYAVSERSADAEQRFRSALICYGAYALATGIARSSQARHIIHGSSHGLWDVTAPLTSLATQTLVAIAPLVLWTVLSEADLPWSQAFGRVWYFAAVALGIATVAAIDQGARTPETPRIDRAGARRYLPSDDHRRLLVIAGVLAVAAAAVTFMEGLAFLAVFEQFRRQSNMIRSSLGFLAAGWIAGTLIWGFGRSKYTSTFLAQLALGASMIGLLIALSLDDLAAGRWFPEEILGVDSVRVLVFAMATLFGIGFAGRRTLLNPMFERLVISTWTGVTISLVGGIMPVLVAYLVRDLDLTVSLGIGLGLCLVIVIALGTLDRSGAGRSVDHRSTSLPAQYASRQIQ